jgi:hypothetical protein
VISPLVLFGSLLFFRTLGWEGVAGLSIVGGGRPSSARRDVLVHGECSLHAYEKGPDCNASARASAPPDLLVLVTSTAELAGAIGLLIPATRY